MVPETVYELPDTFYAGAALVYGDRYAVCEMLTQEFAAEVYDLKEGKVVGKLLHYGNGPQEVLVPIFNMYAAGGGYTEEQAVHDSVRRPS